MGLGAVPGRQAAFREGLEQAVLYAKALGCPRYPALSSLDLRAGSGEGWSRDTTVGQGLCRLPFCISAVSVILYATLLSCTSHTGIPCLEWGWGGVWLGS